MACKLCEEGHPFDGESVTIHAVKMIGEEGYNLVRCEDAPPIATLTEAEADAEAAWLVGAAEASAGAEVLNVDDFGPLVPECDGWKDTNPKDGIGATKIPLHLVPVTAIALAAIALHNGRGKYGAHNWRVAGVRASIYLDALFRHVERWINGEEVDPEDGVPNLGGALACLCILIDARAQGKLIDDRPPSFDVRGFFERYTPLIGALNEKHADRSPRHYTIEDTEHAPACSSRDPSCFLQAGCDCHVGDAP